MIRRREFLQTSAVAAGVLAMGPSWWRGALAQTPTRPGPGPYGPLGPADEATGIRLPAGFSVRQIAAGNETVSGTGYDFPIYPDGAAAFALPGGGYSLAVNSEVGGGQGGTSAIRFDGAGNVVDAVRILGGTSNNCAGGATPWGTWLSCEELDDPGGFVWECDPTGARAAVKRRAMGRFRHEAAAVDTGSGRVYLTEDVIDGGLYRFTPDAPADMSAGVLEIARAGADGRVQWVRLPNATPATGETPTRRQVPGSMVLARAEGIFFDSGIVYIATTSDDRIYAYDTSDEHIEVLYDGKLLTDAPLHAVDNVTVHRNSGDLYVGEDPDDLQLAIITAQRVVAPFLQLTGPQHVSSQHVSEVTGPAFDPSGERLYFSSQRASGVGAVYEISGPFRNMRTLGSPTPAAQPGTTKPTVRRALKLRGTPAILPSTLRRKGVRLIVDADRAGTYTLSLVAPIAGSDVTLAQRRRRIAAGGRLTMRLRPVAGGLQALRRLHGRRTHATLILEQGGRRVTRPVTLRRGR
jgi:hypothetical protein